MNNQSVILLPHYSSYYNGSGLTLNSLLNETEAFFLFVIDDGTNKLDKVKHVVNDFRNQLEIIFIAYHKNQGIIKTLNKRLKYIIDLNQYK